MKNILILGVEGFVGTYLANKLKADNNVYGTTRNSISKLDTIRIYSDFDPLDIACLKKIVKTELIDVVINCVAMANVDECQKKPELAESVNVGLVRTLVNLSNEHRFKLIHFSSNAVYSGDTAPYDELDIQEPKNIYGKLKSDADKYIEKYCDNFLIARIMTVYGNIKEHHRSNPSKFIVDSLKQKKNIHLVNDVYSNLLYIQDLTYVIGELLKNDLQGVFNISGDEIVNRFELGIIIAKTLNLDDKLISECDSSRFGVLADRAANTSFNNTKLKSKIDFKPTTINKAILKDWHNREFSG